MALYYELVDKTLSLSITITSFKIAGISSWFDENESDIICQGSSRNGAEAFVKFSVSTHK